MSIIEEKEVVINYTFEEIYKLFNNILCGCKTMLDAIYFAEKIIKHNGEYKDLLIGMIHGKKYDKVLDYRTIAHTLNELNEIEFREDIDEFINKNLKNNVDLTQLNSILRISKIKNIKIRNTKDKNRVKLSDNLFITNKDFINNGLSGEQLIHKSCPHCNINITIPKDKNYIICGYIYDNSFDWLGCGKDWCNRCNKMLCKSWNEDNLIDKNNRIHDITCCKEYANKNNIDVSLFCNCDI